MQDSHGDLPVGRPKVSVCIPTFNRSHYLPLTIDSVLSQKFSDFELVVVDNASTDDTGGAVDQFSDARLRYYRNAQHVGMVANWNRCLEYAQGEYVAILHDDDLWLDRYLERVVSLIDGHKAVGLFCSAAVLVDAEGKPKSVHKPWTTDRILCGRMAFKELLSGNKILCPSVLVRRQCFGELGRFDEAVRHAADWEMWLRISLFYDIGYVGEPLVHYRIEHGSMTDHHFSSSEGRHLLSVDAINVVERGLCAAKRAGVSDVERLGRLTLGRLWLETAVASQRAGSIRRSFREIRRALALAPSLALRRPRRLGVLFLACALAPLLGEDIVVRFREFKRSVARALRRMARGVMS